ncbi:MAG: hypothetical protein ABIU54_00275 [Candidatus Eisenbacteria bacterium]
MKSLRIVFAVVAMLSVASGAFALGKGASTFSIQIGTGAADLVAPNGAGYITSFSITELEPRVEFTHMMRDDYAFNLSAGIGTYSETNKPGTDAAPGDPEQKTTVSAFFVRVGGDRVVNIGERTTLYFGPGIEYWSGKYKYEAGTFSEEAEPTMRISLAGRLGGTMMLGESWGFTANASHRIGIASADWDGAKANWTASSTGASGGLLFVFGGN